MLACIGYIVPEYVRFPGPSGTCTLHFRSVEEASVFGIWVFGIGVEILVGFTVVGCEV